MNKLFNLSIEFFIYNDELFYRREGEAPKRLKEQDYDIVSLIYDEIEKSYPKAHTTLLEAYGKSRANSPYMRYRVVSRFCRCNFGNIDNIMDIEGSVFHFEHVICPLRGECKLECVVCHPEFRGKITKSEWEVLERWYHGQTMNEIAEELYLSIHTIKNHIRNALKRLDIHSKADFVKFADANNLFK